jgi:hypothetical protein
LNVSVGINLDEEPFSGSGTLFSIRFKAIGTGTEILEFSEDLETPLDTVVIDIDGEVPFDRGTATIEIPDVAYLVVTPASAQVYVGETQIFSAQGYTADSRPIPNLSYSWTIHGDIGTVSANGTQATFIAGRTPGVGSLSVSSQGVGTYANISVVFSTATVVGKVVIDIGTGSIEKDGIIVTLIEDATGISTETTTGTDSKFCFSQLYPGTYTISADTTASAPSTKTGILVITAQTTDVGTITLISGDANNNGYVYLFDFYQLYTALYNDNYDIEVDFDYDGDLDAFDFRVLYNNFFRGSRGIACLGLSTDGSIILSLSKRPTVGEEFVITLKAENISNLIGIGAYLLFDPSIIEIVSIEETLFDWQATDLGNREIGIVSGISLESMPVSGESKEIKITFLAKKEGKTTVSVKDAVGVDKDGKMVLLNSEPITIEIRRAIPLTSALGQSFPNPSEDGCWIPFQLSADAEVSLEIYNILGQRVRAIHLGQKEAGYYIKQDSAIFWDLKNDRGERISAGLYFYRLKAGKFSDTKAMVVK